MVLLFIVIKFVFAFINKITVNLKINIMKKFLFAAFAASMMLSSCVKTFYQVYETEAPGMVEEGSSLVYENEDCKIMYNLWSEDGNSGFLMCNKTDNDLFLILSQTFFIKNGAAFDYFKNREYINTETFGSTSTAAVSGTAYGVTNIWGLWYNASKTATLETSKNKGYSLTVRTKEVPVICIPANSFKFIKEYSISDRLIENCNKKQAYPKKKSIPVVFTKEDTPLAFKNRIAYSFDKEGAVLKQVENEFWVSEVINYTEKEALEEKEYKECERDYPRMIYVFKMASPKKFYNSFRGISSVGKNNSKNAIDQWY